MGVQCIQTAGQEACPEGHYALYEHPNYNRPRPGKTSPTRGQTVIADESVASLNGYHSHAGLTTSVVNKTGKDLELFIDGEFRGKSMTVPAGQSIDQLPPPFDNAASSSRLVAATKGGKATGQSLLGAARDAAHQTFGGKVTEPGKAEAGSGVKGTLQDVAYTTLGGKVDKSEKADKGKGEQNLSGKDKLIAAGARLEPGQEWVSGGKSAKLCLQGEDLNLVLYKRNAHTYAGTEYESWEALWAADGTYLKAKYALVQADGNFAAYDKDGKLVWSTNTAKNPHPKECNLAVQDDQNLVLYHDGKPVWSSDTQRR